MLTQALKDLQVQDINIHLLLHRTSPTVSCACCMFGRGCQVLLSCRRAVLINTPQCTIPMGLADRKGGYRRNGAYGKYLGCQFPAELVHVGTPPWPASLQHPPATSTSPLHLPALPSAAASVCTVPASYHKMDAVQSGCVRFPQTMGPLSHKGSNRK